MGTSMYVRGRLPFRRGQKERLVLPYREGERFAGQHIPVLQGEDAG